MRFFQVVLSGAALINAAMAAVSFTSTPTAVKAGESVKITWTATGSGPVTILLRKGPSSNLGAGVPITTTGSNGEFTWAVPSNLASGSDYALEIVQGSDNNFSGQFSLTGGTAPVSSSAASSSASASATVSASVTVSSSASSGTAVTTSSASSNGTVTSATLSTRTGTSTRATGSATGTGANVPESTGAASTLITSPLALIFGAVAAMAYLN